MMTVLRFQRMAALAAVLMALAVATPMWAQTGGLTGKTTLQNGQPCVKCTIQIDRLDIRGTYHVKTDKKGQYIYIGLPIGQYKVTLLGPDGSVLFYFNNFHVGLGDPTQLDFNLPKEMKEQKQENPQEAKQAEEQSKEAKKFEGLKEFFNQGNEAYQQKNYQAAIDAYEKALPLAGGKNATIVLSRLAESYDKLHQYDQAVATYQKIIQASPDDADAYNNLGSVYAEMNKLPEAQQAFQKAATINPTRAGTYYFNLGAILYNQGKMDEALDAFKKAVAADPKNATAYYYEGQSLMGKATMTADGKVSAPPGTIEAFKKYLELEPHGPNAAAAQAMIQTITGKVQTQYKKKGKS
jgi:tetratricopeptide (TPR) repeat protein